VEKNTELVVPDGEAPRDKGADFLKEAEINNVSQINEENMLLKRVVREIETPMTGVEEVIRQEKLRMLLHRINGNIDKIEKIRKDQQRQLDIQRQQQQIIQQHKNLPKR